MSYAVLLVVEDTREGMLSDTGKKHNTAILLNWKHNVFGTMLRTIMFIVLFVQKLMGKWLR